MWTQERTTKAARITRTITVTADLDFGSRTTIAVVFEKHEGKKTTKCTSDAYLLERIPSQMGGIGVEVVKSGSTSEGEVYQVLLNAPGGGHDCTCPHGAYRGHVKPCRHVEAAL